jgi:glycosyltransferase involved in cell wall biosynthesis
MEPYTRIEDTAGIIARKEARERIEQIRSADILIGIPSYNNARTIGHVIRALQGGLAKYFPYRKAVIVNSDGGSTDGTVEIVKNTIIDDYGSVLLRHRGEPAITLSVPYHGIPGKGSAFRAIFEMAAALNVEACAVVDADLRSITPEWVELLVQPVLREGFDYVAPLYRRHKFDGTITNSIIYGTVRHAGPAADRRGFRIFRQTRALLSARGRLADRCRPLRHRYLDDDRGHSE